MKQAHEDFVAEFNKDAIEIGMTLEIEFGNNRFNDHQVCSASSVKDESRSIENFIKKDLVDFWKADQAFNNKNHNTLKWLVCDAGAQLESKDTGATYRCIDPDHVDDLELGWWSSERSNDSTGVFAAPQWVKSEWFEDDGTTPKGRLANDLTLFFDEAYPNMKSINAAYKDGEGEWIDIWDTPYLLGEDEYTVSVSLDDDIEVYGLRATIYSTRIAGDYARLSEFNAFFTKTFSQHDYIVSSDVSEVREQYEGQRPIGTTSANSFDFELDNTGQEFCMNGDGDFSQYLVENCKVTPRIQAGGEEVQMGVFWTDEWNEDGSSMSVTVNCRDFSKFLQDVPEDFGRVWEDTNVTVPFVELLSYAGIRYADMVIDVDTTRNYPVVFLHDTAPWELFGELALAEGVIFTFDYQGKFTLRNSYVGKEYVKDDFSRNSALIKLAGTSPTRTVNYGEWLDNDDDVIYCEDGMARTLTVSQYGLGLVDVPGQEITVKAKIRTAADQGVWLVAGHDGDDYEVGMFIDCIASTVSTVAHGVSTTPVACDFANGTIMEMRLSKTKLRAYVNGVLKIDQNISSPITEGKSTGFVIQNQGSSGTRTSIEEVTILPLDNPVMTFSGDTNIESGSTKSEVWTNEVVVKLSEFSKEGHGLMRLWGPDNPTILSYARLISSINSTATEISVEREVRQENGSLIDNGWPQYDGILFFPVFAGGVCVGGELIKYESRTEWKFKGCKRGYAGTTARSWNADSYIGEAREWDIQFDGSPVLDIKQPFSTAIDTYLKEPGLSAQAYVALFENDAFTGRLIMANIAKYTTWLEGTGQSLQDFDDKKNDIEVNHTTSIAGVVAIGGENKQKVVRKIEDPTASDLERIRKYGTNKLEITSQWIQSREHGQLVADEIIAEYSSPRLVLNMSAVCAPVLELGDRVTVVEYDNMLIADRDYHVIEIKSSYDGGLSTELVLRAVE